MGGISSTGTFSATGVAGSIRVDRGSFNVSLWGTFVATVRVERSFDGGTTWLPITALGSAINFTAPCSEIFMEPEVGILYQLDCTSYGTGTVNWRISQ
jgi:hypothetical protein